MSRRETDLAAELAAELETLRSNHLHRATSAKDGPLGAFRSGPAQTVCFASNDYLGLAADPRIVEAAREGAARYGVGAGASHLLYGHGKAHEALENALAEFVNFPRALLFSSGYLANLAVITAICGRDDEVFADKLNHASLNDAMILSRARFRRFRHGDLDQLADMLSRSRARRKLVAVDAVFSMDGDIAPLAQVIELCECFNAWLYVDDAHGFGVMGPGGSGTLAHFGVDTTRVIYMATLGKAAGVAGAFVAAAPTIVDYLVNRARTYIYTTAQPPLLAHALMSSLEIIRGEHWRRAHLKQLSHALAQGVGVGARALITSPTAIQPYLLGSAERALAASHALATRGLLVPAIRPPTVPKGTARLRISLSAAHRLEDVARLAQALVELPS
jgi:8-amino-7-oxononanoate synthase